jgi:hypothetical protein
MLWGLGHYCDYRTEQTSEQDKLKPGRKNLENQLACAQKMARYVTF